MRLLLVGHRGCGKTGLLRRLAAYRPDLVRLDLDEEIVRSRGMPIERIFAEQGEEAFRRLERETLDRLLSGKEEDLVVSLGAGFPGPLPAGCRCLWVRRDSDSLGRIFVDRPRLDPDLDPLEEYARRYGSREERYGRWSDAVLTLREGYLEPTAPEREWFTDRLHDLGGALTLLPADCDRLEEWLPPRLRWGVGLFELRDDLLTAEQIRRAGSLLPPPAILYSRRRPGGGVEIEAGRRDWPLELGSPPPGEVDILSLHRTGPDEGPERAGERLAAAGRQARLLKLAPRVDSFAALEEGHRWWSREPERRVFLPRSEAGRWAWYRLHQGRRMALNFFREGGGSAPDQPLLLDWADRRDRSDRFAAVLGDPVAHSHTPAEHSPWFAPRGMAVYAINISVQEWADGALEVLHRLGLRAAAVTAPHKGAAWRAAGLVAAEAERLEAVNTLAWDDGGRCWSGTNTDGAGFALALGEVADRQATVVWGGGGTLAIIRDSLPQAACHAARTGRLRAGIPVERPDLLVWAAGEDYLSPPAAWRPTTVLDLSYREDSPARAFALARGARYLSGRTMFREQARLQREFWKEYF